MKSNWCQRISLDPLHNCPPLPLHPRTQHLGQKRSKRLLAVGGTKRMLDSHLRNPTGLLVLLLPLLPSSHAPLPNAPPLTLFLLPQPAACPLDPPAKPTSP